MNDIACRLYSAAQVRELDRRAIERHGIPGYTLMQRAGVACWAEIRRRWPAARKLAVVCGGGNNGGDGYVIARLARGAGLSVTLYAIGPAATAGDAVKARADWLSGGGAEALLLPGGLDGAEVVVDALFGIGLSRPLQGAAAAAVDAMRSARAAGAGVLAVDIPSGLDADNGRLWGAAVLADVTVSFIGRKLGLETGEGPACSGERVFDRLDLPPEAYEGIVPMATLLAQEQLAHWLPRRARGAHKGSHGHVLVVGGDAGMAGAALMAGRAALRSGAGLVTLATRAAHAAALTTAQPELMCHGIEEPALLRRLMERADVVAIGPGLGQDEWGLGLLAEVLDSSLPLVVDADALNLLAREPIRRDNWVLTPHPGEAARLLRCSTAEVQRERPVAAQALPARYGGVAVLKGAGSLVAGQRLRLCDRGNPGMAVGGMGDVLTGIIAALISQGLPLEEAAGAGVLLHALAGDLAAAGGERGLLPGDLIGQLRRVVNPVVA
ncbi:bifunctional ADP-dependent NAD(P)H-hydrate dehydratase/NAD(P)H-hydrate epimerase [Solimonas fluminis]|uniref:Bifunctional NAD(P)H-hydrate repair enzyme n=1 Tax=Solimonas fluminis TaxID=2086571 RepID=A0A2S5TCB8_9GAMM|nr:NAD(P)H-hydrate dehydratase [Solimonas fluminis]PPE72625.1 bifunctional ADP-dependent NAD(P)H-hydrate dehydratase/NAD(P)H-hydrate epimerase [Solimonas fluminis]